MVPVFLSLFFLAIFHLCFCALSEQLASPPPFSSIPILALDLLLKAEKWMSLPWEFVEEPALLPLSSLLSLSVSLSWAWRMLGNWQLTHFYRAATEECNSGLQTSLCLINMLIGRGSVSACVWINGYALQWFRPGSQKEASVQGCLRTQHNRAFQPSHSRMRERVCVQVSISEKGKERNIQPPAAESGGGKHGDLLPV